MLQQSGGAGCNDEGLSRSHRFPRNRWPSPAGCFW